MITAVVTFYNPTEKNVENICEIARQADRVIVCDNSSEDNSNLLAGCLSNIYYYPNYRNLGLPAAFNTVLRNSDFWPDDSNINEGEKEWIIFFDQDSRIGDKHIASLINEYKEVSKYVDLGCLGPLYYELNSNQIQKPKFKYKISEHSYTVKSIITSSMLTTYDVIKEVGFWNENLFLDYADWDFCWRVQNINKRCCLTDKVILRHSLGLGKTKIGPFSLRIAAPIREYYQMRDARYLLKKDYVPLRYKARFLFNLFIRSKIHAHLFDQKEERAEYIKRAKQDYKLGIHGEYQ